MTVHVIACNVQNSAELGIKTAYKTYVFPADHVCCLGLGTINF